MKEETINPFEYQYDNEATVEIPGQMLHALMMYMRQIEQDQTNIGFSYAYSTKAKEVKNAEGLVTAVELEKKEYPSMNSYMNQQPDKYVGMLGVMALDFINGLTKVHLHNIEKGVAKKVGTIQTPKKEDNADLKLA